MKLPILVLAILFSFGTLPAGVLTFDDITASSGAYMPSTYGGLTFSSGWMVLSDTASHDMFGNTYGSPSGEYAAESYQPSITISSASPFQFIGASFSTFANSDGFGDNSARYVLMEASRSGSVVYGERFALSATRYDWIDFQQHDVDVDLITFTPQVLSGDNFVSGGRFMMDDFTFQTTTIPEPAAFAMIGLGLVAIAVVARRRKQI